MPGPSLGGAAVGGAFCTRTLSPRILSPSLWCRSAAAPAPAPRQLGSICSGASCVCSGLSPPCAEEETNEAGVCGWGWGGPHRTPAPGLSSQDQGREEGWEAGPVGTACWAGTPGAGQCRLWLSWTLSRAHVEGRGGRGGQPGPPSSFFCLWGHKVRAPALLAGWTPSSPKAGTSGSLLRERLTPPDCGPWGNGGTLRTPDSPSAALPRELVRRSRLRPLSLSWFPRWRSGRWGGGDGAGNRSGGRCSRRDPWQARLPRCGSVHCGSLRPQAAPPPTWGGSWVLFAAEATVPGSAPCANVC